MATHPGGRRVLPRRAATRTGGGTVDRRPNSWHRRLGRLVRRLVLVAAVLSLAWVAVYGVVAPPATALMLWRAVVHGVGIDQHWVPLGAISPHLVTAVIASEDTRFCRHWGVDPVEIRAAWNTYWAGGRLRGASTITQQTAKNAFLWPGRDPVRKLLEFYFAGVMELVWSKHRILEVYLNIVEWADGVYGAEAAARHHFGKSAARLNRIEAARLAVVLPNPRDWSPRRPTDVLERRLDSVRRRMRTVTRDGLASCVFGPADVAR